MGKQVIKRFPAGRFFCVDGAGWAEPGGEEKSRFPGNVYEQMAFFTQVSLAFGFLHGAVFFGYRGASFPPPSQNQIPSIDKRNFVSRWFFVCPKVLDLSRY